MLLTTCVTDVLILLSIQYIFVWVSVSACFGFPKKARQCSVGIEDIMSEKFNLKWNDFGSNVSKSFGKLRTEDYLHDVTLVSDDHTQLSAHKLVLSACSEYFKEIFSRNKHANTLLCLEGLSKQDLENILDYMYNGEVHIFQEDLDRFLSIAQRLRLEGLLEDRSKNNEHQSTQDTKPFIEERLSEPTEEKTSAPFCLPPSNIISLTNTYNNEVKSMIESNLEPLEGGHFRCKVCGKDSKGMTKTRDSSTLKWNMRNHVETHVEGLSYSCQPCGKMFRSKNSFSNHKSVYHKNK